SGDGAHVWFFFTEPVMASMARRMGCYLITETMARRHELSLESYDRLFPNQDTLPRGGVGNLIALPLQHDPRQRRKKGFVDERLVPFPDQWEFLARHPPDRPWNGRGHCGARSAARGDHRPPDRPVSFDLRARRRRMR